MGHLPTPVYHLQILIHIIYTIYKWVIIHIIHINDIQIMEYSYIIYPDIEASILSQAWRQRVARALSAALKAMTSALRGSLGQTEIEFQYRIITYIESLYTYIYIYKYIYINK